MGFNRFKNTFFLWVFIFIWIGCASKSNSTKDNTTQPPIIVGANLTQKYLPLLKNKKVAVVANQTSVIFKADGTHTHLVDSLVAMQVNLTKVFAPEHGFRGTADAGEVVADGKDIKTGLPIISLYGKNKKPTPEQLQDVDVLVFDIQDVGVRFYTYISTMHYIMEAAAENNKEVVVLDRPNPNGSYIDGPTLEPEHASFLGMHPIPLVHGMTIAEYAKMINGEQWLTNNNKCNLTVITMENYNHSLPYSLPLRPSPNLPNDQSIALYPSLGLFEGTNINAGRGTEFQFQRYGAPFLDSTQLTFTYTPKPNFGAKYPKHKDVVCYGEDLSEVNVPKTVSLQWLINAYKKSKDRAKFFKTASFTKHAGTAKLQQQIENGLTEEEIKTTWQEGIEAFKKIRAKYLLYN